MRIPLRPLGWLFAVAVVTIAVLIIVNGLRDEAFFSAVESNDVAAVRRTLERDRDRANAKIIPRSGPATRGQDHWTGVTVLHRAVFHKSIEMADAFVSFGGDLNVRMNGDTLLHFAAIEGDVPMMTWLIEKGADVNARNGCEHPDEALCDSGQFADWQPFDRLRSGGTKCTGCDHEGQTPLHAVGRMRAEEAITFLLSRGADVHAVDAAGRTALHFSALGGASEGARVLCAYGADPARRDRSGKTPEDVARAADLVDTTDRYSQTGVGELAGWLHPGGGCAQVAARARAGMPVPTDEVNAAWRAYACTRDAQWCGK